VGLRAPMFSLCFTSTGASDTPIEKRESSRVRDSVAEFDDYC
jgi:hypothetical protein